jgi:hypothetical protein
MDASVRIALGNSELRRAPLVCDVRGASGAARVPITIDA